MPNPDLSIHEGGFKVLGWNYADPKSTFNMYANAIAKEYGVDLDKPVRDLSEQERNLFLYLMKTIYNQA